MKPDEQKKFFTKLKRLSTLSKLGDSTDKLYAQLLLDKRRQILEGQVVFKQKRKDNGKN